MDARRRRRSPPSSLLPLLLLLLLLTPLSSAVSPKAPGYHENLQLWHQLLNMGQNAQAGEETPFSSHAAQLRPLLGLTSSEWYDVILEAVSSSSSSSSSSSGGDGLGDDVGAMTSEQNVTSQLCINHTLSVLIGIKDDETWAKQMLDAMGKPQHGITEGNVLWPGGYNQCQKVRANTTVVSHPFFSGRYCNLYSQPPGTAMSFGASFPITLGVCVPDTCSSLDLTLLLQNAVKAFNKTSAQLNPVAVCVEEPRPINTKAVVAIVICSIILCLMVLGTAVDLLYLQAPKWAAARRLSGEDAGVNIDESYHGNSTANHEHDLLLPKTKTAGLTPELGVVGKALASFSVYTNGSKLLSTTQPPGSLTCVHGVRFLSMSWVVLGHTWAFPASVGMNLVPYMQLITSHWAYQGITNATVSVDSFFVLSGLLVAYLTLKEMKKRDGKMNWFLFYFHRFWRLTPAYMLCLMVYVCLGPYWGEGPFWPAKFADEDFCADNWWTNLLYINNLVNTKEMCFGHSWYLANDMQFYILSPLIFVPLFYFPVVGVVVAGVFLLITSIIPGALSQHYGLPEGLLQPVQGANANTTGLDYFDIYYLKPYNRMGPYIVGMLAGYFLYRNNCKLRIHWLVNASLWAMATASALAVLYGLFESSNGHPLTVPVAALYNAVSRQVWGACVAWVVVACVTGNGGFVNSILSWSGLVPLSRLTYCIYLLHIMVLTLFISNAQNPFYLDDLNLTFLYLGTLVASCMVAFVASMAFEAPMMGLERAFLRPSASSEGKKQQQ